jgi:hypothetical protein
LTFMYVSGKLEGILRNFKASKGDAIFFIKQWTLGNVFDI